MFQYHIWCDIRDTHRDVEFARNVAAYLDHLRDAGLIHGHSLTRRAFGFGPEGLGEFHIVIELDDLSQMDRVFGKVAARAGETEDLHRAVYSMVAGVKFSLERTFPDAVRMG